MCQNNKKFKTNRFNKRVDRFTNPRFIKEEYEEFDFNNNIKSNNIEELYFTNYTSSNICKKYLKLEELCIKIANNNSEWTKTFVADEIDIKNDIPKLNRIYKIIQVVNREEINRKEIILKFKNVEDPEIQFYIKQEKNKLKLYLIDIYHLGIEAKNKKTKRIDARGIYNSRRKCNYDIVNINSKVKELEPI
nr:MAG TPA: hypothetical protein [Caudoviricetes sp.]